jgi:predicted enzyme related to lactoylglutathione lyase
VRVRGYAEATPCWVTLTSGDMAGSVAFYTGLFGWQYRDGVFRLGDRATAGLVRGTGAAGWLTYVSTEDIVETTVAVDMAGGRVLQQPVPTAPGGLMAIYADPAGAAFAGWQRQTFAGAQVANEPGALLWSEVAVRDESTTESFYGKVFGWSTRPGATAIGTACVEWMTAGRVVAGMVNAPEILPQWRVFFEIDSAEQTARRCEALGGRVLAGPVEVSVGRYAQIQDPQGGAFAVVDLRPELRVRL